MTTDFVTLFISHAGCGVCADAVDQARAHAGVTGSTGCTVNDDRSRVGGVMHVAVVKRAHLVQPDDWAAATAEAAELTNDQQPVRTAMVILFKPGGKYYTEERWRIPTVEQVLAVGGNRGDSTIPYCMRFSPDFRQIDGGPVLVDTQEPWGYPHLLGLP